MILFSFQIISRTDLRKLLMYFATSAMQRLFEYRLADLSFDAEIKTYRN